MKLTNISRHLVMTMMVTMLISGCSLWNKTFHKKKKQALPAATAARDTTKKGGPAALKPYNTIITKDVKTQKGFFTVHKKDEKYYFELPADIFGRDILIVNRVSRASAEMRNGSSGYAGDQIGESVFRFEKGPSQKIFLRRIFFAEYAADSTRSMYASVQKNNVFAIAQAFPILSKSPDSSSVVIDVTEFLNSDNDVLYFQKKAFKDRAGMGAQQNDKSYVDYIHTYKNNVEIRAVKTYSAGINPTSSNYTVELNSSMVLLPEKPMQGRLVDSRVGYFATGYRDFDANPQGVKDIVFAKRWKLEPKPEDADKYMRGELVEPVKPIVFYIDPVTPKKWVPYLKQGVLDWQKAFEKAGFKNAIYALEAPANDSTWSIDDASHSAIIYRPSAIANAMGPSVADPRSGEILESHIFWYHNVMTLLRQWYMLQAGMVDKRARKTILDDELMGSLIRFVSSHEIGHTLGLRHNFGSSSTVPVEKLRDKKWVEENGHTPSIMDYARFNYVAQPEDGISEQGIFPRIGDYDTWAIEWGYRWYPQYKTPQEEQKTLVKVTTERIRSNRRLWFGGESEPFDARCQSEDLGDDAIKASSYGIKNLKRIVPQLQQWVNSPDEGYDELYDYYKELYGQFFRYMGHVMANIGSIYTDDKVAAEPGAVYSYAPYRKQKDAVKFVNEQLFKTPYWLNNKDIMNKLPVSFGVTLGEIHRDAVTNLLNKSKLSRLWTAEQTYTGKTYTVTEYLSDLNKGVFTELYSRRSVDFYRRNLQKTYVYRLMEQAYAPADPYTILGNVTYHFYATDLPAVLKNELREEQQLFKKTLASGSVDKITRLHLQDLINRIESAFQAEKAGLTVNSK